MPRDRMTAHMYEVFIDKLAETQASGLEGCAGSAAATGD